MFQLRQDLHFPRNILQGAPFHALVFMHVLHGVHIAGTVAFLHDANLKLQIFAEIEFHALDRTLGARIIWSFERRFQISKLNIVKIFNSFFAIKTVFICYLRTI